MADISLDPHINQWWLDRSSPNDAAAHAGFQTGVQIAQRGLDRQQQAKRDETALKFKMLDFALEGERNDLAIAQFQSKQLTDLNRQKGLAELTKFLADSTAADKLTDSATRAEYWRIVGRNPFIDRQTVDQIWDNTFQEAMRRKDQATTHGTIPALIQYDKYAIDLEHQADAIEDTDPDEANKMRERATELRNAARLKSPSTGPPGEGTDFGTAEVGGINKIWIRTKNGFTFKDIPSSNIKPSKQQEMEYAFDLKSLQTKLEEGYLKPVEFDREKEALDNRFRARSVTPGPAAPAEPAGALDYDNYLQYKNNLRLK